MKKIIIANWKMNPKTELEAIKLTEKTDHKNLVIAPPFPFLGSIRKTQKLSRLSGQDIFWEEKGAYTSQVSASQIKSMGAEFVILGHSERRALGETNEMVAKKTIAAISSGLIPIVCIGETLEEKNSGKSEASIFQKLDSIIPALQKLKSGKVIFTYEPVWAISTQKDARADTPENALSIILKIKEKVLDSELKGLKFQFIYGGSVDCLNAEGFLRHNEIEGALVGGASLRPEDINQILKLSV